MSSLGIVASGHIETSRAAQALLEAGGNAFDAALGAMCAACVCEPMLASLGGGGFLLAQKNGQAARVFDFFVQAPSAATAAMDFYPIQADFGTATQEFHIGMASIAVPGVVAGLFAVHSTHCRLPLAEIFKPAIALAREGVEVNALQRYISEILRPIIEARPSALALSSPAGGPERLARVGERISNPALADTFEALACHGPDWFYAGEPGQQLVRDCRRGGGLITAADLVNYRVKLRNPVTVSSHGASIACNSPPSPGGTLIAFALSLLDRLGAGSFPWGSRRHAMALARVIQASSLVREGRGFASGLSASGAAQILSAENLDAWRRTLARGGMATRGTTHLSVADAAGNLASLTLSNGEGSAYVLPQSGIMLNNMLGEEDLNPAGFHRVPAGERLASMMTPAVVTFADGAQLALGSGGSNRIRSAILQVLVNMLDYGMDLGQAVAAPRLHLEGAQLSIESGYSAAALGALESAWPGLQQWPDANLFFGGVHAVERLANGEFRAAGDPRRGGATATAVG